MLIEGLIQRVATLEQELNAVRARLAELDSATTATPVPAPAAPAPATKGPATASATAKSPTK